MKNDADAQRLIAFHTTRVPAALAGARRATEAGDTAAAAAWHAVADAHRTAAKSGTRFDSDLAEAVHAEANRTHPDFPA